MTEATVLIRPVKPTLVITTETQTLAIRTSRGGTLVLSDAGRQGPPGAAGSASVSAVCSETMPAGLPVIVDRTTGQLAPADAGWKPDSFVAGLLSATTDAGFVGQAERAEITLSDWTAAVGSATLVAGSDYFLAVGGGLSVAPPDSNACTVLVGRALTASRMLLDIQPPIQL